MNLRPYVPVDARAVISRAVASARRLDSHEFDTLRITRSLIDAGVWLGDEEAWGEGVILDALWKCDESPHEADVVAAILNELDHKASV